MLSFLPFHLGPLCFSYGRGIETDKFRIKFEKIMMAYGPAPMLKIGGYKCIAIIWICPEYNGTADFYRSLMQSVLAYIIIGASYFLIDAYCKHAIMITLN